MVVCRDVSHSSQRLLLKENCKTLFHSLNEALSYVMRIALRQFRPLSRTRCEIWPLLRNAIQGVPRYSTGASPNWLLTKIS